MRLTVTWLRRVIKRDFSIQFGREQLTSYGGLELLRRFLVLSDLRGAYPVRVCGTAAGRRLWRKSVDIVSDRPLGSRCPPTGGPTALCGQ